MLHGLGPKSVISILEKVTFYLKKLRWIAGLPPQKKGRLRESIKKDYLKNITTYSAWGRPDQCNQLLCGLNPKWTCSQRHLPLHHVSIQPETPPQREEEIAGQKSSAHSLSTQNLHYRVWSTPETNLDLFHGTYQSSLTTRQGVFRHPCYIYNCKPED